MKTLIVYYSRTGITKKVGENLSFWLKAKKEEVVDEKNRKGPIGYVIAGKDATNKKLTKISRQEWDPKEFNMIIIGTPVWAWTVTPAIRTYIEQYKDVLKEKELAFFCTMGSNGDKQTFEVMHIKDVLWAKRHREWWFYYSISIIFFIGTLFFFAKKDWTFLYWLVFV